MDQKICLDTDISIEILKNTEIGIDFVDSMGGNEAFISTVSVFELFMREKNLYPVEELLFKTHILDFTELSARKASEIFKDLKSSGKMIDMRDLFIAAIAITNNCTLATLNKKHFENIKELKLLRF